MNRLAPIALLLATALHLTAGTTPPAATPTPAPAASPSTINQQPSTLNGSPDPRPFTANPTAGGIKLDTEDPAQLTPWTAFTIIFPEPMVPADRIDAPDIDSPLTIWPDLASNFTWRTQTQGVWNVTGPRIPGQTYRVRLTDNLADLANAPLPTADWGFQLVSPDLIVTEDYGQRENLSARPQIPLEFNFPMRLADAADGIWIQDRASRKKFPVEVLLNVAENTETGDAVDVTEAELPTPTEFRVRPRDPLPVGHFYDLIVDQPHDVYAGRTLPFPRVFPLGTTRPLAVRYVAARNWPTDDPHIEVKFNSYLGDADLPADALTIEPPVKNLRVLPSGEHLIAYGDFDTTQRYQVTVSDQIKGDRGYTLAEPSLWGATFRPKQASLIFPEGGSFRQRSALGLRFAFVQANTGPVTWTLSRIPLEQLAAIDTARTAEDRTTLVTTDFDLTPVATGDFPATTDDTEVLRAINQQPTANNQQPLTGPYLLEATAQNSEGRTVANNAIIFFNETVFTQKADSRFTTLRLAGMASAKPLPNVPVRVVTADLTEITRATTDANGTVTFPSVDLTGSSFFLADTPDGPTVSSTNSGSSFPSGYFYGSMTQPDFVGTIITDRPLYRPGQEAKFKGLLRSRDDFGTLTIPANQEITWQILAGWSDDVLATGTATTNEFGSWDAAWTTPEQGKLGDFRVRAKAGALDAGSAASFQIEEYRTPAFSVVADTLPQPATAESKLTVSSQYFHGAPNVGSAVHWTATWLSDHDGEYYYSEDGFQHVDLQSENHAVPAYEVETEGDATLDADGRVTLTSTAPFKDPGNRANATVLWQIDVTGPDGQTISGGTSQDIVMNDVTLGVRADSTTGTDTIAFDLQAIAREENTTPPAEVEANLFLVRTKTVKERIAPFVYRYRNTDVFESIEKQTAPANGRLSFTPTESGRYVLVVSPLPGQTGIPVSDQIYLAGPGDAELPVTNDQHLDVKPVDPENPAIVGQDTALDVLTPSPGIAWVTVETDRILDTLTLPIDGNASRITLPVKPEYAPNATVCVYLLRPGQSDELPGEMFGSAVIAVTNPTSTLTLAVTTEQPDYEPRTTVRGDVTVTVRGQPVPNAELAIYAVDDSVLTLGGWTLPDLLPTFFPNRPYGVTTYAALTGYVDGFTEQSLSQKGFVVGGGGKDGFGNTEFIRKNFKPLILWQPSVVTDADGRATFECEAPDNLTAFRVIALAQTKENQFGAAASTFTVSKPLQLEPALPRFLREGDEIELRVVARQKVSDSEQVTITCTTDDSLELTGPATVTLTAKRDVPAIATFQARATNSINHRPSTINFAATAANGLTDATELSLPIAPRTILVHESTTGTFTTPTFTPADEAPADWKTTPGTATVTLSTSPYLPKLLGIPMVLEYPHGCFEQKSSRLLVYTALSKLLAYLPVSGERNANYARTIEQSFAEFDTSILPDDLIPYWPYGTEGNAYVTIQTAWAVAQAIQSGYEIPERLAATLPRALDAMITRTSRVTVSPTLRAFALFARSQFGEAPSEELQTAANDLLITRDRLTDEGRAMLAIALHEMDLLPDAQADLVQSLPDSFGDRPFDPATFSSPTRTEAICTWARLLIQPRTAPADLKARLETLMANSDSLSTQENLWLLIAFNHLLDQETTAELTATQPTPDAISPNASAAEWTGLDLATLADFTVKNLTTPGTYVLAATRALPPDQQTAQDAGLRVERVLKNLTDPARTGTAAAPFRLGDQILITYQLYTAKPQSYVALEDQLPAGLEVVNPNLAMFAQAYNLPADPNTTPANLSYSELRDQQTNLYFDQMPTGTQSTAVLARATAAGTFAWPSTTIAPMYDARFHGRSAPSKISVK